jgi:hypothetical protein
MGAVLNQLSTYAFGLFRGFVVAAVLWGVLPFYYDFVAPWILLWLDQWRELAAIAFRLVAIQTCSEAQVTSIFIFVSGVAVAFEKAKEMGRMLPFQRLSPVEDPLSWFGVLVSFPLVWLYSLNAAFMTCGPSTQVSSNMWILGAVIGGFAVGLLYSLDLTMPRSLHSRLRRQFHFSVFLVVLVFVLFIATQTNRVLDHSLELTIWDSRLYVFVNIALFAAAASFFAPRLFVTVGAWTAAILLLDGLYRHDLLPTFAAILLE